MDIQIKTLPGMTGITGTPSTTIEKSNGAALARHGRFIGPFKKRE
jgi:hypothetical protein